MKEAVTASLYCGFLLIVPGSIAWITAQPFIFPSLGPSAFVLAFNQDKKTSAYQVVGGHLIGVIAGWLAYSMFASGIVLTDIHEFASLSGLRLSISGVSSVTLTAGGMTKTQSVHAPACATTLIYTRTRFIQRYCHLIDRKQSWYQGHRHLKVDLFVSGCIVSLGILASLIDVGIIMVSVVLMFVTHIGAKNYFIQRFPSLT